MMDEERLKQVASKVITHIYLNRALLSIENNKEPPVLSALLDDERLLLGRLEHACNPQIFRKYRITHVVNVCQAENIFENGLEKALSKCKLSTRLATLKQEWLTDFVIPKYLRCPISDQPNSNIGVFFEDASSFINLALQEHPNNKILLHCHAGVSRSATIAISYFMIYKRMSFEDAFQFVKSRRNVINPNPGFLQSLLEYQKKLDRSQKETQN